MGSKLRAGLAAVLLSSAGSALAENNEYLATPEMKLFADHVEHYSKKSKFGKSKVVDMWPTGPMSTYPMFSEEVSCLMVDFKEYISLVSQAIAANNSRLAGNDLYRDSRVLKSIIDREEIFPEKDYAACVIRTRSGDDVQERLELNSKDGVQTYHFVQPFEENKI